MYATINFSLRPTTLNLNVPPSHQDSGITLTTKICLMHCSLHSINYVKFFDYFTSKVEQILIDSPFAETSILGNFLLLHQLQLSTSFNDWSGEQALSFAIMNISEQLAQHLTRFPDHPDDTLLSTPVLNN